MQMGKDTLNSGKNAHNHRHSETDHKVKNGRAQSTLKIKKFVGCCPKH